MLTVLTVALSAVRVCVSVILTNFIKGVLEVFQVLSGDMCDVILHLSFSFHVPETHQIKLIEYEDFYAQYKQSGMGEGFYFLYHEGLFV